MKPWGKRLKEIFCHRGQAQAQEAALLRQWKAQARQTRLEMVPLRLALAHQSRNLAETGAAKEGQTDCRRAPLKLSRRIAKRIVNASNAFAKRLIDKFRRRPCLRSIRTGLIWLRRALMVKALLWGVRLAARYQAWQSRQNRS